MISIIVSSYKPHFYTALKASVATTIGAPYEIIQIENHKKYSLAQAYNLGAKKAKFDILCFLHEDIQFITKNWGLNILSHFEKDVNLSLIGLAGSTYKSNKPTNWGGFKRNQNKINIVQRTDYGNLIHISSFAGINKEYVKLLDGVFMVARKSVWAMNNFDENIPGFHLYDIDFSLRINRSHKVAVVYDILLQHLSEGNYDDDWLVQNLHYHSIPSKQQLFDDTGSNLSLIRKAGYLFLAKKNVSWKFRFKYIKAMGLDLPSLPYAVFFLYPGIAKILKVSYYYFLKRNIIKQRAFIISH